jgi:hypothetical protein
MFKKFKDSDEVARALTPNVHLWNLAPNIISTVHFGYQYEEADMVTDMANLLATGACPTFFKFVVNRATGVLEEKPVNSLS